MPRLFILALLVLTGCATSRVEVTPQPSTAEASGAEVARGDDLFPITEGGAWGYVDRSGAVAIEPQFDAAGDFSEGRAAVRVRSRWGYIRPDGSWAVEPRFALAGDFASGRARVGVGSPSDRLYGYIDASGAEVVPPVLPYALDYSEGLALVRLIADEATSVERFFSRLGGRETAPGYVFLDRAGEIAFEVPGVSAASFSGGLAPFEKDQGFFRSTTWGYLDASGAVAIEPDLDGPAFRHTDGLARVGRDGQLGFVDEDGTFVVSPAYPLALPFGDGLAPVQVDGLWGFVNASGDLAIAPRFRSALPFSGGLAPVQTDAGWGYLSPSGDLAIPATYTRAEPFARGLARVYSGRL
ncbi:MAG: WG repeat-containing protein, partial [Bacteroidota bacterium]